MQVALLFVLDVASVGTVSDSDGPDSGGLVVSMGMLLWVN